MERPVFFIKRGDRLIARLQSIVYCWRFARQAGGRTIALWPPVHEHAKLLDGNDFSPSQIFDLQSFYATGGGESLIFLEGRFRSPPALASVFDPDVIGMAPNSFDAAVLAGRIFHESAAIPFTFRNETGPLRQSLRATFETLPLHLAVANAVERCRQQIGRPYVAVHVRRGDIPEYLSLRARELQAGTLVPWQLSSALLSYVIRMAPLERYFPAIKVALAEKRRVVIFSDAQEIFEIFTKRFPGAKLLNAAVLSRNQIPIQKAFIDFKLLAEADHIIGTAGSSYSSFAAMVGAARYTSVAVTAPLEQLAQDLDDHWLSGVTLRSESRARIHDELRQQYEIALRDYPPSDGEPPLPVQEIRLALARAAREQTSRRT